MDGMIGEVRKALMQAADLRDAAARLAWNCHPTISRKPWRGRRLPIWRARRRHRRPQGAVMNSGPLALRRVEVRRSGQGAKSAHGLEAASKSIAV
ncbi:hypothetical protein [Rhizobium sp. SL86]|uniref:hypothetical protein n=1 Tax=Rhizobium sp. SL86 TaxID=2995148 RepID=UPI002272864C|nr:hypothetical protein [Rhizobium sp. SL86]MCY1666254.1 hypothetical protein [Rhizobium sp. SL86]